MTGGSSMKNIILALALVVFGSAAACSPEVPANPTYATDVGPILGAHCTRCHGAGGTLNPNPDAKLAPPADKPQICYLNRYEDMGDCSVVATCQRGAGYCGAMIVDRINRPASNPLAMPPTPADRLNDWEIEVLTRWSLGTPPAP
jgi:hypothetical protein